MMVDRIVRAGLCLALVAGLAITSLPATGAEARQEANRLLVEAARLVERAEGAPEAERFDLLRHARENLERIQEEFSHTDLAVQISTGQRVGDFDPAAVYRGYDRAFVQICLDAPVDACLEPLARYAGALQNRIEAGRRDAAALREQLRRVTRALKMSEERVKEREGEIHELGRQLNLLLVEDIERLGREPSAYFDRLWGHLEDRSAFRAVDERLVLQADDLFETASAAIEPEGRSQLTEMLLAILALEGETGTQDSPWVVQVEGHTDQRPIRTREFPSNWELSVARARAVVAYFIENGVPAHRLAVAGFAEFHPVAEDTSEEALRANRRIEFRVTTR